MWGALSKVLSNNNYSPSPEHSSFSAAENHVRNIAAPAARRFRGTFGGATKVVILRGVEGCMNAAISHSSEIPFDSGVIESEVIESLPVDVIEEGLEFFTRHRHLSRRDKVDFS